MLALLPYASARAQTISLIRDAEIEETLRQISGPILDAAGLGRNSVRMYIVNDPQLNAFVAGGSNLFLNTGLLMRTENVGQVAGVIAHEVGHIAGGHLSRVAGAQRRAAAEMILATVLGAAAAVAGAPGLGTAIITGGQSYAQNNLMRFSRSQEQAADQAAVSYLDRAAISSAGLAEFFKTLENQNVLAVSRTNPYLQTHPLTRDRIRFVENHVAGEGGRFSDLPPGWPLAHGRMVVKLQAFLLEPRTCCSATRRTTPCSVAMPRRSLSTVCRICPRRSRRSTACSPSIRTIPTFTSSRGRCCSRTVASPKPLCPIAGRWSCVRMPRSSGSAWRRP